MRFDLRDNCSWHLAGSDSAGRELAIPCKLPNDNASILLDAGVIPDPYAKSNEKLVQWIARKDWTFRGSFQLDGEPEEPIFLNLESVDTCADIFINGAKVGTSDNMFRRFREWVSPYLKKGGNRLEIRLRSPLAVAEERAAACPYDLGRNDNNAVSHLQFVRKVQCHGGWDWGICLPVSGVYGEMYLQSARCARIEHIATEQKFSGDAAELLVTVELEAACAGECSLAVEFAGRTEKRTVRVKEGRNVEPFRFRVEKPELWNPAGFGGRVRYPLTVSTESETVVKQIGFRTLELVRIPEGGDSETFFFRVNGNDVFCKGANWIPYEAMPGRETPERLRELLEAARDANMNMIRVWGGGKYESELFYDLCDEYGILVWQDCMFACVKYPVDDEFLKSVDLELEYQVKRLSSHPCLALWCGDNEIYMCCGQMPADESQYRNALLYHRFNHAVMESVGRYNRGIPEWNSSPCKGPEFLGETVGNQSRGDLHYWQVWHGGEPFSAYYTLTPRFCSEFGFQSFPSMRTIRRYIQESQRNISSPEMENHQKNGIGNARIMATFARYFRMPKNFENIVYLSQVQQGLAIQTAVEYFRSLRPYCMGVLYWQLNDNWPVASWSGIDYLGDWKVLHYMAKRFFAPQLLTVRPENGRPTLFAVNDASAGVHGRLRVRYRHLPDGQTEEIRNEELTLPGQSSTSLGALPETGRPEAGFFELSLDGETVALHQEFFPTEYKRYELPEPHLCWEAKPEEGGFCVRLTVSAIAFFVFAELRESKCAWSDNAVTLYPESPVELHARPARAMSLEEFQRELVVYDLKHSEL